MFESDIFTKPTELNEVIDKLVEKLSDTDPGTKEYTALVDQLTKLYKLKEIDITILLKQSEYDDKARINELNAEQIELEIEDKRKQMKLPFGLRPETVALLAANLIGIGAILGHERLNVISTKALSFVTKLK